MTKHSKNNTASSVFSYAEYKKLDYGTKRQRLGHESMRQYDACSLCLQKAREPLACKKGHLFCKECVYSDLLSQKKDIKRQKTKLDALKREAEAEAQLAKIEARERVLKDFERGQLGLGVSVATGTPSGVQSGKDEGEQRGTKRKHDKVSFSPSHVERVAQEAEEAALKRIKLEQEEALKAKLPDFWLPSLTPTYTSKGPPKDLKDIKVSTTCRGGSDVHEISLKSLVPVTFTYPSSTSSDKANDPDRRDAMCPSCKKSLSNSVLMFLLSSCSHVVCKTCVDTLVRPSSQCVVCDKEAPKDSILPLQREGTGFAGGGLAETSKAGVAFQG
ncbi:hypothetical protein SCHPADRAFT_899319 [Schizopora paradoxa]|uniref:RING-type domain-containing protein n=1 Tax=Schizopora paradoxa TaxID=27342 RepID=A0A0H2SB93_9AGAM|nr:hypothetical protein SCHPADRAFT_899319 [Schizopora paradoxa]